MAPPHQPPVQASRPPRRRLQWRMHQRELLLLLLLLGLLLRLRLLLLRQMLQLLRR